MKDLVLHSNYNNHTPAKTAPHPSTLASFLSSTHLKDIERKHLREWNNTQEGKRKILNSNL